MTAILVSILTFGAFFLLLWQLIRRTARKKKLISRISGRENQLNPAKKHRKRISSGSGQRLGLNIEKIDARLEQLDLPLQTQEYLAIRLAVLMPGMALLLFGSAVQGAALFTAGLLSPEFMLRMRRRRRLMQFEEQLSNALISMANALRAGFSFLQAMDLICREEGGPLAVEFRRALQEMNLGTPVDEALNSLQQRLGSDDMELIVTAILVQRQVGGDLAGVLEQIHWTIQERNRLRREIKALTAQGRLSGMIIGLLPVFLVLILFFINPQYMSLLFTTTTGRYLLLFGLLSETIGFWLINRIVSINY